MDAEPGTAQQTPGSAQPIAGRRSAWLAAAFLSAGIAFAQRAELPDRAKNPFAGDPAAITAGKELYTQACQTCHGGEARETVVQRSPPATSGTVAKTPTCFDRTQWRPGHADARLLCSPQRHHLAHPRLPAQSEHEQRGCRRSGPRNSAAGEKCFGAKAVAVPATR